MFTVPRAGHLLRWFCVLGVHLGILEVGETGLVACGHPEAALDEVMLEFLVVEFENLLVGNRLYFVLGVLALLLFVIVGDLLVILLSELLYLLDCPEPSVILVELLCLQFLKISFSENLARNFLFFSFFVLLN